MTTQLQKINIFVAGFGLAVFLQAAAIGDVLGALLMISVTLINLSFGLKE